MKEITLLLAILFSQYKLSNAQGRNNIYLFGYTGPYRGIMDLKTGVPVITADSISNFRLSYTHANISDVNGNLLFYTNGTTVMDGNHDTMPNGTGLSPCAYSNSNQANLNIIQASIIIPMPGDSNKYYLFHESLDNYPNQYTPSQIYFSIVDMTLNGGFGNILQKNISFFQDTLAAGMLTACKHANGRDWWLCVPEAYNSSYYLFLITPTGVQYISKQTIGQRFDSAQGAFSPDGTHYGCYNYVDDLDIYDFDRCTGVFSNPRHVTITDSLWGLGFCFSPNSKLAYAASSHLLFQFNLDSANLANSMDTVAVWDSTYNPFPPLETGFEFMQIGPDQKIYMTTTWATSRMHYINYPDSIDSACDVHQHALILPCYNGNTIPNFPNYFLGPVVGSVCDSLGVTTKDIVYDNNLNLRIRPSPAANSFYLNYMLPTGKDAMVYVYNTLGKLIHKQRLYSVNQNLLIHCNAWQAGLYYLKVVMDKGEFEGHAKVVVVR